MKVTRELIDETKKYNKNKCFEIIRMAKETFYDDLKTNFDVDSRNMILNATMGRALRDLNEDLINLGAFLENKIAIEILEGLVETFKEAEREMMEAQDE